MNAISKPRLGLQAEDLQRLAGAARHTFAFLAFELAFYVGYSSAMSFSQAMASPFWFPDSILLCALLRTPPRVWWMFVLGVLPIRLSVAVPADVPYSFLLWCFSVDSLKGVVGALVMRRVMKDPLRFASVREFLLYGLWIVALIPAASAVGGASARYGLGYDYWQAFEQWFLGDAVAQLVVTPFILYWLFGVPSEARAWHARPSREVLCLTLGLALASGLAVLPRLTSAGFAEPWFYAPVPFLFWAAIRFGMRGATGAMGILALTFVTAALLGEGPFAGRSPTDTALALQHFLMLRAAPLYLVALFAEQNQGIARSLRASEARYREVVESQTDLVCRYTPDTTLTFANAACGRYFGRRPEQLLGSKFVDLLPADVRERVSPQILQSIARRQLCSWDQETLLPSNAMIWQHWVSYPIVGVDGSLGEFQAIGRDITDRKRAEEATLNLAHVSRLAVVGELTAMVAHEINQPLGAILSNAEAAELLLESKDPPLHEIRNILADIRKSDLRAEAAIRRIRGLLSKREINLLPLDLNDIVAEVLRLVVGDATRRRVRVRQDLAQELPLVLGDRVYLQQVLLNLLVNAMDAMRDTEPASRELTLSTRADDWSVEVAVADHGHGIPEGRLRSIFESFYTTKKDGMGLGLSIARSIVETHRGKIAAWNNPNGGATFSFRVPVA